MGKNSTGKGLAAIYRQEIIQDITLFTSQSAAIFYDKLFTHLDFTLPRAATGRRGFPKEAMVCAFIVMKCEGFSQVTDWTYDRFLKRLNNEDLKEVMAQQVKKLYDLGVVDASFIGLDSTPVAANTKQNNPKSFATDKFKPENHPKSDPDCALGVHSASNQHNERRYEYYWGYKNHVLVDCISGLPLYELTTPANVVDSTVVEEILAATNSTLPLQECTFLGDKGYDVKAVYDLVKDIYNGEAVIPLNKRNTKNPDKLPAGRLLCSAGLAMHKDGKTFDNGRVRQKFCCPLRSSKSGCCPCGHKNWNNGKNRRGCTKYLTLPSDYRLFIDRESLPFKRTYALRTECERYYSRFKASGQERLWVRNANSAANLNSLAHISALAVALAAVLSGAHSYRSAKLLQRSA